MASLREQGRIAAMKPSWLLTAILTLVFTGPAAPAVDLTKVERTLAREPAYQTNAPKYGLLVFGPEAKSRAWVVLDGDVLCVDRNCNSDLTEEGERAVIKKLWALNLD